MQFEYVVARFKSLFTPRSNKGTQRFPGAETEKRVGQTLATKKRSSERTGAINKAVNKAKKKQKYVLECRLKDILSCVTSGPMLKNALKKLDPDAPIYQHLKDARDAIVDAWGAEPTESEAEEEAQEEGEVDGMDDVE